jgi:hypothetical protein
MRRVRDEKPTEFCSDECMFGFHNDAPTQAQHVMAIMAAARATGNDPSHGGQAGLRRTETVRRVAFARRAWETENAWTKEKDSQARQWFAVAVSPLLATRRISEIRHACNCSESYAATVREGSIPHPMHYPKLAALVGVAQTETE